MKSINSLHLSVKKILIIGLIPVFFGFALGQIIQTKTEFNYKKAWTQIDSLKQKGLYQQAFVKVQEIAATADKEKNEPQFAKAILNQTNLLNFYSEDPVNESLEILNENLKTNIEIRKGLLYSFRADYYKQYYNQNRYRFNNSENIVEQTNDIKDWSESFIKKEILKDYLLSLNYKKQYDLYTLFDFEPALQANREGRIYKPTLYDLMVWRVLDYTKNTNENIEKAQTENWDLNAITNDKEIFDSTNTWFISNYLFKQLIETHHLRPEAKLYNQLQYLDFIYATSSNEQKDSLYQKTINKLLNNNSKLPLMVMVANKYAEHLLSTSAKYNKENQGYRWNLARAKELMEKTIEKYPDAPQINQSKNILNQITTKTLNVNIENYILSNKSILAKANIKNTDKLVYRIIELSKNVFDEIKTDNSHNKLEAKLINKSPLIQKELNFKLTNDYREHSFEFEIAGLKKGFYALVASNSSQFKLKTDLISYYFINVTDISYLVQNKPDQNFDIIVRSRENGEPIENSKVTLFKNEYDYKTRKYKEIQIKSIITNKNGIASYSKIDQDNVSKVVIENNEDILIANEYFYGNYNDYNDEPIVSNIYTDRLIYRPGQTIQYKGILHKQIKQEKTVIINQNIEVRLTDVNGQEVGKQSLATNEFGSYSGQFTLPENCLTGYFNIEDGYGSLGINVEEYKRPKFETYFNKTKNTYKLNQEALVYGTAKSYSGAPISNAKVKYTIYKNSLRYYTWRCFENYYQPEKVFTSGEVQTNDTGGYVISFVPLPDKKKSFYGNYQFRIEANVTDISGETHNSSKSLLIGDLEYNFSFTTSDAVKTNTYGLTELNDTSRFKILLSNNEGEEIDKPIKISIEKLASVGKPLYKRLWEMPDTQITNLEDKFQQYIFNENENPANWKTELLVGSNSIIANNYITLTNLVNKELKEGVYRIKAETTNSTGKTEQSEYYFSIKKSEKLASELNWFLSHLNQANYQPGDKAVVKVFTHLKNSKVYYSIEQNNSETIKPEVISGFVNTINNEGKIEIPVERKHRGGFFINLSYQENNKTYTQRLNVNVPYYDKDLVITTQSIRDNLLPGSKENWSINISGPKKEKIISEFLCTMYDASLDDFASNYWNNWFYGTNNSMYYIEEGAVVNTSYAQYLSYPSYKHYPYQNPQFDYFIFHNNYNNYYNYRGARYDEMELSAVTISTPGVMTDAVATEEMNEPKKGKKLEVTALEKNAEIGLGLAGAAELSEVTTTGNGNTFAAATKQASNKDNAQGLVKNGGMVIPRSNFNETAFFYPQLKTNENGDVSISFTMPESLTKWKFMGMAHTADLKSGLFEKFITTSKPLMCTPNFPRTFRQGDEIIIKAKIDNTTDQLQNVLCKLNIEDELENKNANKLITDGNEKTQTIKAHASVTVSWKLNIKEAPELLKITTTASGTDFTDGEVTYIPVLSDKQMIIEAMPFVLDSTYGEFNFASFASNKSNTRIDKQFSLEYSANPIWTAIQSLPYLMEYPHECSEQLFSRFFANQLAHHVVNKHPEIEKTFNKWKIKSPEALLSNLQKNSELKQVLLNETPWVLEAKSEAQQKANMAMLFDLNKMSNELKTALKKLLEAQSPNGGWPWFKGMPDNEYITQYIVEGIYNLEKLGAINLNEDPTLNIAVNKGVNYLQERQKENYQSLVRFKINLKEYVPGRDELINLLIFSRTGSAKNYLKKEFNQYFINQAKTHWLKLSLDCKVILAKILFNTQDSKATELTNSFKDNAIKNPKIGWYWKENIRSGYYVNSSVELHSEMLELFSIYKNDKQTVKQLSKWLLLNKHTNKWENTKSTVKAIYALLLDNPVINSAVKSTITIGNKKIDINESNSEPGTGYFKQNISLNELNPEMSNVKISTSTKGVSYGALYWKYLENIEKINASGTSVTVTKSYYVKKANGSEINYVPIANGNVKLGDEILVKLNISTDRDLEYVHLKDLRPSGLEPLDVISGTQYNKGLCYYQSTRDAATDFFLNSIPKGTYEITYRLKTNNAGSFSSGTSSIQCMYAPEFTGTAKSVKLKIEE